ncbi:hypothetical protein [Myroides profundi]|uniref:Uncharacterized protein n=1 Tax=Myroides profundi TaxID=480520 RepID=A0AAJ4W439_MYRPR|nr:hypothetical protein [Myroides profundi]AJH14548.1 hypothetical protein MPR_1366 [Myroides profundi]SEQ93015.1 hypothetical protein SAMN04488089_107143 [Myroides profundi]
MKKLLTRKNLYELVWSTPLNKIAQNYNISTKQLKDSCSINNIPLPEIGYWSKLKYNKQSLTPTLDNSIPLDQEITLHSDQNKKQKTKLNTTKNPKKSNKDEPKDILIIDYLKRKTNQKNGIHTKSSPILDISSSEDQESRALNLMNDFLKLIRQRGFTFIGKYGLIVLEYKNITISFSIREHRNRIPTTDGPYYYSSIYKYSGKLIFSTGPSYRDKQWADSKTIKLEDKLLNIIQAIELMAQEEYQWKIKVEESRKQREVDEKKQREIEKIKRQEHTRFELLINQAQQYDTCTKIRNYIQEIERKTLLDNNLNPEIQQWLNWAKSKVDAIDPTLHLDLGKYS